jgi:DNA helicase II / ATP-dependent DNA helicase PcrA
MHFHADLHVHSKYSRATSRDLDLEHTAWWAARKGLGVVGTGDCVHPAWLAELKDKLTPASDGLFALKPEIDAEVRKTLPPPCQAQGGPLVRFMLSVEISTIYKKGDRTRKIHHLIYVPDFDAADRLAASLGRIGNIASDGRPILGLDSRDLLEIALASGPDSYLVPAHIWTPWFAALGSQSGFDSIRECYGDLSDHVFAVETGLSSDPAMNWRVSFLDRYRLTSNSDAHSPGKLGREATRFACEPGFLSIRRALETGDGYGGTVEFFPEEGKYHADGHRACGVRLDPAETIANEGRCPVCGGRVTLGVAHRVEMLADRKEQDVTPPPTAGAVTSLVPLPEILSEIVGGGVASQGVARAYDRTSAALGADFTVLQEAPVEDVAKVNPLLGEAVTRLRAGAVIRHAGYDGEYGVIRLFQDGELDKLTRGDRLFDDAPAARRTQKKKAALPIDDVPGPSDAAAPAPSGRSGVLAALDADQARAAEAVDGPLIVIAGPGSGKTRMLTHRLAHLVLERGAPAASCLAVTFTRRATEEMQDRLAVLLPSGAGTVAVHSFHSLGLAILRESFASIGLKPDFRIADEPEWRAALAAALGVTGTKAARLLKAVSLMKRTGGDRSGGVPPPSGAEALAACREIGLAKNWVDFDDLVALPAELLQTDAEAAAQWRARFAHLCVDEFQDVDEQQYRLLRCLAPPSGNVCVIGDPNQAIYGFRGADAACFARFAGDFPSARTVRLGRNYRSTGTIVTAAAQVIGRMGDNGDFAVPPDGIMRPMEVPIVLFEAATERAEAEFVAATIESLMGGHDLLAANKEHSREPALKTARPLGFADFAVLCRTGAQSSALREAFDRAGIPFKKSSPVPIAGHACVRSLLAALDRQGEEIRRAGLPARIAAAAEQIRRDGDVDIAALAEARRWLTSLAEARRGVDLVDDLAALREQAALATEADFWDARADRVSLLTMHAAKGLEFPVVFVAGMEDGLVPFSFTPSSRGGSAASGSDDTPEADIPDEDGRQDGGWRDGAPDTEERRLFYVAMTRAKDRLFLSRAVQRTWRGALRMLPPSPFLRDIAAELVVRHAAAPRKERREALQYSLF